MTDGIFTINHNIDHTDSKPVQVFLSAECAAIVHRWMATKDMKNRTAAVDALIRLGAADDMLYGKRRRKK